MERRKIHKVNFKKSFGGREEYFDMTLRKDQKTFTCTTRAIAHATGKDFMEVLQMQFEEGLTQGRMPNEDNVVEEVLKNLGWVKCKTLYKGNTRKKYKGGEFPLTDGSYIIRQSGHLTCIKDGVLYDSWDCRDWACNTYYKKRI